MPVSKGNKNNQTLITPGQDLRALRQNLLSLECFYYSGASAVVKDQSHDHAIASMRQTSVLQIFPHCDKT